MISVLILTLNEEKNLRQCLGSVVWSDDIVVLDDGSTDSTVEIAADFGARVIVHSAGNERLQREYSLKNIKFKYSWVYNPDADEITPADLKEEMLEVVSDSSRNEVAYRVRFKNMFMGKWIKHCSLYPTWVVRLFKPDAISFERDINLNYQVNGATGYLDSHFEHYSFNKGLSAWFEKHNRYSDAEAVEAMKFLNDSKVDLAGIFCLGNKPRQRKALKNFAWKLPFRSVLVFNYLYFFRLGFLDGKAGFRFCCMRAIYERMIDLKIAELKRKKKGFSR